MSDETSLTLRFANLLKPKCAAPEKEWCVSDLNYRSSCFPGIPMMSATSFSRYALEQAGTSRRCLRETCFACARFAERHGWQVEVISQSPSEAGGYKEIIAKIVGAGAYSKLKFESGGHRVQRVPATETQGASHLRMYCRA